MLQNLRNVGKTWVGKVVAGVLFTLLILSFAVWGIGDIFRGGASTTVVRVGDTVVDAQTVRNVYTRQVRQLSARLGQPLTPEQARLFGVDQQVLSQIATEAVLDERARQLGIRAGDELVRRSIVDDPGFQTGGRFDPNAVRRYLSLAGLSEQAFTIQQARALERQQIVVAVGGGVDAPVAAEEAIHRYDNERRSAEYVILPEALGGDVADADDATLQAFFEERRSVWRAPEYRAAQVLAISPDAIADPAAVSADAVRARYDQVATQRFGTPERRAIQRIPFSNEEEARAAAARIAAGEIDFAGLAAERGVSADVLELGTLTREAVADPAVAEAAFALDEGAVSQPVVGRFGASLVRVPTIEPADVRALEDVEAELRVELAREAAADRIRTVYDEIEDQRAAAIPLAEIAEERGLEVVTIAAVDRQGRGPDGAAVAPPGGAALVQALFETDVGVDNFSLRTENGGYVWYDLTAVEPSRDRTLDEVRADVLAAWRQEQAAGRLDEIARGWVERLRAGETLEALAAEAELVPVQATDLARGRDSGPLTEAAVTRIFATRVGEPGSAPLGETGRVVYRVSDATVPPYLVTTPQAEQIGDQLAGLMAQDLLEQYLAYLRAELGAQIDQEAFRLAIGSGAL